MKEKKRKVSSAGRGVNVSPACESRQVCVCVTVGDAGDAGGDGEE